MQTDNKPTGQELAPIPAPPAPPTPALVALFSHQEAPCVVSWDVRTPAGRELLQRCEETPDDSLRELVNLKLSIRNVYAKEVELTREETGECVKLLRICVETTEGKVHACMADGVRESLMRLFQGHGLPPWSKGVPVIVKLKPTKRGFNRLVLLEDFDKPKGGAK